jgi:hypothetical protein
MLLTLLSGLFGGVLRLAPELLKFLDAKNDRQHELDMQDKALAFQQLTGSQRIQEMQVSSAMQIQTAQFNAMANAYSSQAAMAGAGGVFASFISSLVRPVVTFFVFFMWAAHKIAVMVYAFHLTGDVISVLMNNWDQDDTSMLTMIVSFWFVGRAIEKAQ